MCAYNFFHIYGSVGRLNLPGKIKSVALRPTTNQVHTADDQVAPTIKVPRRARPDAPSRMKKWKQKTHQSSPHTEKTQKTTFRYWFFFISWFGFFHVCYIFWYVQLVACFQVVLNWSRMHLGHRGSGQQPSNPCMFLNLLMRMTMNLYHPCVQWIRYLIPNGS